MSVVLIKSYESYCWWLIGDNSCWAAEECWWACESKDSSNLCHQWLPTRVQVWWFPCVLCRMLNSVCFNIQIFNRGIQDYTQYSSTSYIDQELGLQASVLNDRWTAVFFFCLVVDARFLFGNISPSLFSNSASVLSVRHAVVFLSLDVAFTTPDTVIYSQFTSNYFARGSSCKVLWWVRLCVCVCLSTRISPEPHA